MQIPNGIPVSLTGSDVRTVVTASALFDTVMASGQQYLLTSTTNCWFTIGTSGATAAASDGSHYLAAGQYRLVAAQGSNTRVAIIRDTADGNASLSLIQGVT